MRALILYSVSLYLLINPVEPRARRISNVCFEKVDGASCHQPDKSWQLDGVCVFESESNQECIAAGTQRFQLNIIAKYRSLSSDPRGRVTDLFIRGSGPGLSWERSLRMRKSARSIDTWSTQINYIVDSDGLPCLNSTHCTLNQRAFEFRIYQDDLGKLGMKGPNFYVSLPVSNSMFGAVSYRTPSVTVFPWFFSESVSSRTFQYKLQLYLFFDFLILNCRIIYPPSFNENIRKNYPLVILFDSSPHLGPLLEYLFVHEASVEELVVFMIEPPYWNKAYMNKYFMTPFHTHYDLFCQGTDPDCSRCQTCWVKDRAEPCTSAEFIVKSRRCLSLAYRQGWGTSFIRSVENDLVIKAMDMTSNRALFDPPRHRVTMIGHTDFAVTIFYAAVTRPDFVQNVAMFSPRFHLPLTNAYEPLSLIFDYISHEKEVLLNNPGQQYLHFTQKYYFDHGENDNFFFPLADTLRLTEDVISDLKEKLNLLDDVNIINFLIPNERMQYMTKDFSDVLSRLKYPLTIFHSVKGGGNKDYVRSIKVSQSFLAQRLGSVLEGNSGGGSVITLITSGNATNVNGTNGTTTTTTTIEIGSTGNGSNDCKPSIENCPERGVPVGVFIAIIGVSAAMSAVIAVILMCLREGSRRAAEKEEKEDQELLEEFSSDDDVDL